MSWNKITCWIFLDTWASMITGLNFIGSNKSAAKKCAVCIMHPKIPTLNLKHKKQHPQCHPQQSIVETILVELGGDHTQNTHTHANESNVRLQISCQVGWNDETAERGRINFCKCQTIPSWPSREGIKYFPFGPSVREWLRSPVWNSIQSKHKHTSYSTGESSARSSSGMKKLSIVHRSLTPS